MLISTGNLFAQELSFSIKTDKTTYRKGEPVSCSLILKNVSGKEIVINNRFLVNRATGPHEITLQVINPGLHPVPFSSKVNASYQSNMYTKLLPGKTITNKYVLTEDHEISDTGNYTITAYYENLKDAPASLKLPASWKGTLISPKVSFTIR